MPSVARELPLDQPLYRRADLNDHRRNILRLARSFPPGSERNHHRQVASLFRALFKNKSGWMRILLRALAVNVMAIYSPLRRKRRKHDRMTAVEPLVGRLYTLDELTELRRNTLRYARSFPPGDERNQHRRLAVSLRTLFKGEKWLRDHVRNDS
jgi:hypothetical protein